MKPDTIFVKAGRKPHDHNHGVVNPPVYHASTILQPTLAAWRGSRFQAFDQVVYGRRGTPTTFALDDAIAGAEGGDRCVTVGSGLAAVTNALVAFLKAGDHLLMVDNVYGPTRRFCDTVLTGFGVETTYYDPLIGADIDRLVRDNTKVVYLESPGSYTFEVQDVPAIAEVAHSRGAVVIMDNTWASPYFFKPFEHGVDVSIQAVTKYIGGHSDIMSGALTTTEAVHEKVRLMTHMLGACPGADDCYLAQRGLRTLGVRMPRHQSNALAIADWLKTRPEVERVLHPALEDHPGHEFLVRDYLGSSGLFGAVLKPCSETALAAMFDGFEHFGMGASWGGYESLMIPTDPSAVRTATRWGLPGQAVRIHAGLEDIDDLIADLEAGLDRLTRAA
jgi:cystathionine beta-lyase